MWADNETSEDLLGFKIHADLILEVIKDDALLPVSIGVFGDWGSGKSSILQIIYNDLKGEGDELKDDTLVLYFNGWVFEGYDDAKAALLETIVKSFEENRKVGAKVMDETKKLLKSVNWMRVLGLGFKKIALPAATAYFTGGLSLIPFLASELKKLDATELAEKIKGEDGEEFFKGILKEKKEDIDETTLIRDFRDDFSKLVEKSKIKKLVVIIDDLDRCTHERIIENLEAIKLFLNVEKTAFIIGADPRIVRHAIEHRYRSERVGYNADPENKNQRIVTDYLEKLIQIPYNLPRLSDPEVETYITLLFCKRELTDSYPKVIDAFKKFRDKDRYGVFGLADINSLIGEQEKENLQASIKLIASLSSIISEGLNVHCHLDLYPNPIVIANEAERLGIYTIGVTNLPSHFIQGLAHLKTYRKVRLAIGMHPLYAQRHQAEFSLFSNYLKLTSYVGEVGLDFSKEGIETKSQQIESFKFVLSQVKNSPKILSVHSRGAEKEVLNYLIQYDIKFAIFHWYTGPLEMINVIAKAGYLFSVNPAMIKSNSGRNVVTKIPLDNLLTESDGPFVQIKGRSAKPSDLGIVEEAVAEIQGEPAADVRNKITNNFQNLIKSLR